MSEIEKKPEVVGQDNTLEKLQAKLASLRQPLETKIAQTQETINSIVDDAVAMAEGNAKLNQNNETGVGAAPAHRDHISDLEKNRKEEFYRLDKKNKATREKLAAIQREFESLKTNEVINIPAGVAEEIEAQILETNTNLKNDEDHRTRKYESKSAEITNLRDKYGAVANQSKDIKENGIEFAVQTLIEMHKDSNPDFEVSEEEIIKRVKKILEVRKEEAWGEAFLEKGQKELASLREIYNEAKAEFKTIQDLIDERIAEVVLANDREIFLNPNATKLLQELQGTIEKDLSAWMNKKDHAESAKIGVEALTKMRDDYRGRLEALESKILDFIRKHETTNYFGEEELVLTKVLYNRLETSGSKYGTDEVQRAQREVNDQAGALKKQVEIFMQQVHGYALDVRKKVGTGYDLINKTIDRGQLDEYRQKLLKRGIDVNIRN